MGGVEEALNDSVAMARFGGLDPGAAAVPDETTICKFRHLLEVHDLGTRLFQEVLAYLEGQGLRISRGTIVDGTIINAPSSTKDASKSRNPDMHQTRKGQQWYFGMKAHVGVDSRTKLIHNVADSTVLPDLLHGDETAVWGDQAYHGQRAAIRDAAPQARDCTNQRYRYKDRIDARERANNQTKSRVRAKVEYVFAVLKLKFGFTKARYRGLDKNAHRLFVTCALANLFLARRHPLRLAGA